MTTEKSPIRKKAKCKLLQGGLALTAGLSLIIGTGTLAGFFERQTIAPQGTEITAGNLQLAPPDKTPLNNGGAHHMCGEPLRTCVASFLN